LNPEMSTTRDCVKPEVIRALNELCSRIMVGIASAATQAYRPSGIPMIRNTNIKEGRIETDDVIYLDPSYEYQHRNKRLKSGDVVVVRTGYPGTAAVVPIALDNAQCFTSLIIRPNRDLLDSEYLCTFINSNAGQRQFSAGAAGGAQKNVNAATLSRMTIPLPSIVTQRNVVAVARSLDRRLECTRLLIEAKRVFKRGLMQQLLSGQNRLPEFRARPWEMQRFDSLCEELSDRNGKQYGAEDVMGVIKGVGLIAMRDRVRGKGDLSRYKIVPPDAFAYNPMRLNIGSIAHNRLGRPILVSPDYEVFRCRRGAAIPGYVNQLRYSSYWNGFMKRAGAGSVRVRIYFSDLARLRVPALQVDEQSSIDRALRLVDSEINLLAALREQTELYKRSVLSGLLAGDLRVRA